MGNCGGFMFNKRVDPWVWLYGRPVVKNFYYPLHQHLYALVFAQGSD